jgi:hypothetical protein
MKYVLVGDDEDYDLVSQYNWTLCNGGYARTSVSIDGFKNLYSCTTLSWIKRE